MEKWAFILFIALLGASCNGILNSRPSGTLSEKQMVDVLVDIHLTEASLKIGDDTIARLNDTTQLRIRFAQIFLKHDISPDDFNNSLTYYLEHIEDLDKIYKEVINKLTALEATLQPVIIPRFNRLNPDQKRALQKNPWYKSMNHTEVQEEIQYFSPSIYTVQAKVNYPEPLR